VKAVFADTFYWIALSNPAETRYRDALALDIKIAGFLILTTDEVLSEFLTFFAGDRWLRERAIAAVKALARNRRVHINPQTRESFQAGFDLYASRPDKGYSLTDCISMQTMRREGLTDVLTNDRHFEQEGFRALFGDS
jgi:predicted nucleic acid-binding protein